MTHYVGQRGEYYYESETYTAVENGEQVTRTRQVRRTRWYPASGVVEVRFDDVLILGSGALPEKYARRLASWDFAELSNYDPKYLVGFQAMRYDVDLGTGFLQAQEAMQPRIYQTICNDIGGDEQNVNSQETVYNDNTFKLLLLPIWVGGYRYRSQSFRLLVNGQTGEIQGEAPISVWKVALAVFLGLCVLGLILFLYVSQKQRGQ